MDELKAKAQAGVTADTPPQAHKTSHESEGSDELDFDQLSDGTTYKRLLATERTKLAGIETGADVTADNPPQAHGASVHTDRPRPLFIPVPGYSTAGAGQHGTLFDASSVEKAIYMFRLPADFVTLTAIKMVWNIVAWDTSERHVIIDFLAKFGATGESYEIHSNADADRDITIPAFELATIREHTILASLFSGITKNDFIRLSVERDADHASDTFPNDLNVLGILVEYTADM